MDLTVEMWPVERLVPYARNPRKNDEQVERMAASIREFGFRIPVVAKSDGNVIDGHLRLKAALVLGLSEVPVALADDLTDAQVKAFRIMANKSAEWAAWDDGLLRLELEDLKELDYDLLLTGHELLELDAILKDAAEPEPPAVPESFPEFDEGIKNYINSNADAKASNGGDDTISAVTAMGYDAYYVALEAIKAAGSPDAAKIKAALPTVTYTGVSGSIAFDDIGDAVRDTAFIKTADTANGAWVLEKVQTGSAS